MPLPEASVPLLCSFCGHAAHDLAKCALCKCKGKPSFWRKLLSNFGTAVGEAKFGGN